MMVQTFSRARDSQNREMFLPLDRGRDFLAWGRLHFWMKPTELRVPVISEFAAEQLYFPAHE